ncbi:MAG: penicillin-binding protein 2, partial [Nevskiales bacterium]
NAVGRSLRELEYQRPQQGDSLYLTIDAKLQVAAENAMGFEDGAVVAIEPRTGGILALVSKPNFDPGLFVHGIDHASYNALNNNPARPLFNRALQGQYPPGSTVKPMMALGGLQLGLRGHQDHDYCPGFFTLPNSKHRYRDWKRSGHGRVDMQYAITQSCDIYFYKLAIDMGVDRIHDFASLFGLGRPTGVDLPREKQGVVPSQDWKRRQLNQPWYKGETVSVGIGQGYMTTTPLQLADMTATMARHGQRIQPHALLATEEAATGQITSLAPKPLEPVVLKDDRYWDWVTKAMVDVTRAPHGTARSVGLGAAYITAGKTGTSQVIAMSQDQKYAVKNKDKPKHERDHALFIAFAPVEDPKIALAVLVEHGGSGGSVAAPIARKILDAYLEGIEVPPPLPPEQAAKAEQP